MEQNNQPKKEEKSYHSELPGKPKIDIQINKQYDKNGNLVKFDSAYSSYYISQKKDSFLMDSLITQYWPNFKENHLSNFDKRFNDLFFNDSLMSNDFFHKDFFKQRYLLNTKYIEMMMNEMDSLKNEFYKTQNMNKNKSLIKS